jgi:hypothetical protein
MEKQPTLISNWAAVIKKRVSLNLGLENKKWEREKHIDCITTR